MTTAKETFGEKLEFVAKALEVDAEHLYALAHKELDKLFHVHQASPESAKAYVAAAVEVPVVAEPATQNAAPATAVPETTA